MTYNVIVTPTADAEAMEAVAWYAERSTDAAQRWHERLTRAINSLAKLPTRCPVSQEDSKALGCEVRLLLYGKAQECLSHSLFNRRRHHLDTSHPSQRPRPAQTLTRAAQPGFTPG